MIDSQIHVWARENLPNGNRWEFARRAARARLPYRDPATIFPRVGEVVWDPDGVALLKYLDECQIEMAIHQVCDFGPCFGEEAEWSIEQIHRHAYDLTQRYPGRIKFCCGVDPRRHDALQCLERCVVEFGAVGWQCFPANGFAPNDPIAYRMYEKCLQLDVPVVIRTGTGDIGPYTAFSHPFLVEDVARSFRDLDIVMEHAGGGLDMLWREALMVASVNPNVTLQLGLWQNDVFGNDIEPDREGEFLKILSVMRRRIGAHRILWGSDHDRSRPARPTKAWAQLFQDLPATSATFGTVFSQKEATLISGENARRIFRLDRHVIAREERDGQ